MTSERASSLLSYNRESGKLFWKVSPCNAIKKGAEAGRVTGGYRVTKVDYVPYPVHRLIWLIAYGEFPKYYIDHIDGNRLNNRLENLRDVPAALNQKNRKKSKNNTSGITGVHWDKVYKRWVANIKVNGKWVFLGGHINKEDAGKARDKYMQDNQNLGFTDRHGK